ncbi:MAG: hypothetical protein Q8L74_02750 [Nitrospirota bacterium]|nr:hypothetical protein [Nitrospirota bacterium]MDP2381346.1 hypothetical protein [Nitrospirota bacterium]MDP3596581.1 hypothetical protein [Nitrospirota bacterium]
MSRIVAETIELYRSAFRKTGESLARGWMTMVAVVGFGLLLVLASQIASPLGMIGGFLLGAVNALLVGATLSLVEQSITHSRVLTLHDIVASVGHYFWDVIGIGFVLWLPLMALDMSLQANPFGQLLSYAVLLLIFLLLNPAPEIVYQVRHDSPLDVFKTSYEFVLENWIEWFLPFALILIPIVLSPMGLQSFFSLSSRVGRGAGLDFFQLLVLPFTILGSWLDYVGIPSWISWYLGLLLTPPLAVAMLLFRGHLFASLHGMSRRQRRFASPFK